MTISNVFVIIIPLEVHYNSLTTRFRRHLTQNTFSSSPICDVVVFSSSVKVAMVRAQVCVVSDTSSGVKHLKLIKVSRNKLMEIDDQEAAYLDVTGKAHQM